MILQRVDGMKHGFLLKPENTQKDWMETQDLYDEIHCIICSKTTLEKHFNTHYLGFGSGIVTINNHIPENVIFINHKF